MTSEQAATIMVIDDDDVDIRMLKRGMKKSGFDNRIEIANDGEAALCKLRQLSDADKSHSPYIVLLDLNMPVMNGFEFLTALRQDENLKQAVIFVLTTSDRAEDRQLAYSHNVAGYLLKDDAGPNFSNHLSMLQKYLLSVKLPVNG